MKTLRVFYTIHQRQKGSSSFKKIKSHSDFSHEDHERAKADLYTKYGKFHGGMTAPDQFIEIHSHTFIDARRESVLLESENRVQDALLTPTQLFAAQSRKPEPVYHPRGKQ